MDGDDGSQNVFDHRPPGHRKQRLWSG
jgi:hypothetical protein